MKIFGLTIYNPFKRKKLMFHMKHSEFLRLRYRVRNIKRAMVNKRLQDIHERMTKPIGPQNYKAT